MARILFKTLFRQLIESWTNTARAVLKNLGLLRILRPIDVSSLRRRGGPATRFRGAGYRRLGPTLIISFEGEEQEATDRRGESKTIASPIPAQERSFVSRVAVLQAPDADGYVARKAR